MGNTLIQSLFVLTLLQLCRAQISDDPPESWYSANVINDGYQPKPISEIFSTDRPFSSTNPIIVLPQSSVLEKTLSSTVAPSSSSYEEKSSVIPSSTPFPPASSSILPQLSTELSSRFPSQPPNVEITQFTEQTLPSSELIRTQSNLQSTSYSSTLPPSTIDQQSTQSPTYLSSSSQFLIPVQNVPEFLSTQQQLPASTAGPLSNYFLIYQQAPQNVQGPPNQDPSLQGGLFGVSVPQQSTTRPPGSTVIIQPPTTVSPLSTRLTSSNPTPSIVTSSQRPSRAPSTHTATFGVSTSRTPTTQLVSSTRPFQNKTQFSSIGTFPVRIRVLGPRGSITHVNINSLVSLPPSSTTRRPTTTRTRKTPKPKRNTYEACLAGCKTRGPICAIPLSATWIDPEQLKGFPSVCHMACFNSYKKEPYEKLLDGRCGRLRTRIQTFDSKTKLKRDELKKAQYIIDDGDRTIVEVSPLV